MTWSPGIKSKQTLADDDRSVSVVLSLKLSGSPWSQAVYGSGKAAVQARAVLLEVSRVLAGYKWRLAASVNFTGTTDSLFFQWCPGAAHLEQVQHCGLLLSRYDRLRLLHVPPPVANVVRECAEQHWYQQVRSS